MNIQELVDNTDFQLLQKQMGDLVALSDDSQHEDLANGIIHFLDAFRNAVVEEGWKTEKEVYGNGFLPEWVCTDPDSQQYGRRITEFIFDFKQEKSLPQTINLAHYTDQQIEGIINSYGYTLKTPIFFKDGLRNVREVYGEEANWVIAECIFETELVN